MEKSWFINVPYETFSMSIVYHILYQTCKYHIPMNNTHLKYTLSIKNILFATAQNLSYLDAEENGKVGRFFSFFSFILSLVYQGSHLRWWYSTLHIFHHLFMLFSIHIPCPSQPRISADFFFQLCISKVQSVYLKGEEYPQATQPLMSLITQACDSVRLLVSLTLSNLPIAISHHIT